MNTRIPVQPFVSSESWDEIALMKAWLNRPAASPTSKGRGGRGHTGRFGKSPTGG